MQLGLDFNFPCVEKYDILLVEDDTKRSIRRSIPGVTNTQKRSENNIFLRVHQIKKDGVEVIAQEIIFPEKYKSGTVHSSKINLALRLIEDINPNPENTIIVANASYGSSEDFIAGLYDKKLEFVVELRPSFKLKIAQDKSLSKSKIRPKTSGKKVLQLSEVLKSLKSSDFENSLIAEPTSNKEINYSLTELGLGVFPDGYINRVFVAQRGGISGVNPSTIFALSSLTEIDLKSLINAVGWARWIRPVVRHKERIQHKDSQYTKKPKNLSGLITRPNLTTSNKFLQQSYQPLKDHKPNLKGVLRNQWSTLNVVELFAGAGGMGLGFLMANSGQNPYNLIFSGEVNPIYVQSLRYNHRAISRIYPKNTHELVPEEIIPVDLRDPSVRIHLDNITKRKGDIQVLIGGPPCQGFSSSNRNSGGKRNPNNKLFNVFLDYVEHLRPAVFLLENVQGVAWAKGQHSNKGNLLKYFERRMKKAGYLVSLKLLDASWYGIPQFRYRFFAVGIRNDLGYTAEDFGSWGPYPTPTHGPDTSNDYVTVREAISDLPTVGNGYSTEQTPYSNPTKSHLIKNTFLQTMRYGAEPKVISEHVTSRHADYVIKRYELIPEGGNWESIKDQMTNYANVSRTHSNIYRRLKWDEPSITIGHYRKSMLIHPSQNRGLSWREAARLQSFPDWARFAGCADEDRWSIGLVHKQQQLANAVCPLLTKAVAEFIQQL